MPAHPTLDALDDAFLRVVYDAGALERGRTYADGGRAKVLSSEPGRLRATCNGSGRAAYVLTIRWSEHAGFVELDDTCTCPIGGGCKHCVAAILTARRQAQPLRSAPVVPLTLDWRRVLGELEAGIGWDPPEPIRLALQVVLTAPSRYAGTAEPVVTIRPMRRSRAGKWVKTGASWRDVASAHGYELADAHPLQRAALRSLASIARLDRYDAGTGTTRLADLGPDVWYQLQRAVEVGVELIGGQTGELVELSSSAARATVDLTAEADGAVTLSPGFVLDGHPLDDAGDQRGLLGTPPHGLWIAHGRDLRLIPLAAPLHPSVDRLLTIGGLTVPAREVDELLDTYQPELARHATVGSSNGSVAFTTSEFAGLLLTVERSAPDVAALRWSARYRRGHRATDHPLFQFGRRGRDPDAEADALADLALPTHLLPRLAGFDGSPRDVVVSGPEIVILLTQVLPWLAATDGIEVEVTGGQPQLREATEEPRISLTVTPGDHGARRDGNDWFDLDVEVSVDGETVDFVTLFAALNRDDPAIILPSGTWLRLDRHEFAKLRELIHEARGLADPAAAGAARLNPFQTSWWDELARLGVVTEQSRAWTERVGQLAALTAPEPVPVPAGLDATLRRYQQEGFEWLAFLHRNRLGGILADDMGLGKTVQTLALCLHILQQDPGARFLVVAPTSVVDNWAREAARFAPGLSVRTITETSKRRGTSLAEATEGAQLVVTSYALFRLEFEAYAEHPWELLLLDEAQFVKNHQGKTYQCVRRLDAATKIAITGTPLENTLMDLWSLLSITAPGLYPDPKRFSDTYRKPIESGDAPELLATLRRRIAPLMRRRTKDEVLTELPPKTEQVVEIELSPRHARIYATQLQRQRQKVLGLVGDVQKHRFEILKSLTILRQLALDPGLVDEEHDGIGSAKLDRLLEDLTQVVAEGHRALVFSQFTRFLARVRARLDAAGIAHSYLDGRTRDRADAIARFKEGDAPVFVISLKAGGFGLNLTEADYCFVLDPWWNPATESQAVDRAHRMGQQNPVMVYRYVSTATIEEKVMELKARKSQLFSSVMDAEGTLSGALTESDIRGLLDLS